MSLATWLALLTATLVISFSPGAGAVNTMTNSIAQGWRRSFWGVLGQQIALVIQLCIVALGVGAVVAASPITLTVIRWLGAAYLVYLGGRMILARVGGHERPPRELVEPETPDGSGPQEDSLPDAGGRASGRAAPSRGGRRPREGAFSMIRRGLLVNLLNPKAIVFFLAFIPPFIDPHRPQLPQYAIIAATCVGVDVLVMWFGFAALAKPLGRLMDSPRGERTLNLIFGCCFLLVAALLLFIH